MQPENNRKPREQSIMQESQYIKDKAYINGQWVDADNNESFEVTNPATGALLGTVPNMGKAETETAIRAAKEAFPVWRAKTARERAKIMRRWHDLIIEHVDDLAAILTAEQGKPLAESKGEVIYGASFVEWFAEEAKRIYGDTIPTHNTNARVIVTKEPIGVVGAITPWNFPNAMITRKLAPALAAGCTMVLKPAEDTPFSALALAALAEEAGFPPGVLNFVTGDSNKSPEIGKTLTTHPDVRKITFTGSTRVGKILMRQSADTVKKVSLELGGNAPFIVFESADLDKAVDGAMRAKYRNAGQVCICANRIYVQNIIYDEFAEKMKERVEKLVVGPGDDANTNVGPLINAQAIEKIKQHVEDALAKGGELLCGGKLHDAGPLFFEPTLIKNMKPNMLIKEEETFGPVAGLFKFSSEEEVIYQANDTQYGLASYFYSNDLGQCFRVAEALEYGMVAINESSLSAESIPFGGIKESGIGREGSKYGIDDFVEIKYVLVGGLEK